MNKFEDNVLDVKCNEQNVSSNKKAKESSETSEDITLLNHDALSESLANVLHIKSSNSNLTNGTNDHENCEGSSHVNVENNSCKAQEICEESVVNSVQYCNELRNQTNADIKSVRSLVQEALEQLETAISLQDQNDKEIEILSYQSELQMPEIMRLIQKDLSEPYSIYTYRYFIHNWPKLCFLARHEGKCIGAIVCKLDMYRNVVKRGYIAMLAVDEKYRKRKIGSRLVRKAIQVYNF